MGTRAALLAKIRQQLVVADIPDAANEARDLVLAALLLKRIDLLRSPEILVMPADTERANALVLRRLKGEPVDRILGYRDFRGRIFQLNADTLSPREDSEALIDLALEVSGNKPKPLRILDLGTGTGCLLLTLLAEMPDASGLGIDSARGAVLMAAHNAELLGLEARARFTASHWFEHVSGQFDLIVSNPPYIETSVLPDLEREVRDHDPVLALDGGGDGLDAYRAIASGVAPHLNEQGYILVELGMGQADAVINIFRKCGFNLISKRKDGGQILRALAFQRDA